MRLRKDIKQSTMKLTNFKEKDCVGIQRKKKKFPTRSWPSTWHAITFSARRQWSNVYRVVEKLVLHKQFVSSEVINTQKQQNSHFQTCKTKGVYHPCELLNKPKQEYMNQN